MPQVIQFLWLIPAFPLLAAGLGALLGAVVIAMREESEVKRQTRPPAPERAEPEEVTSLR